jgi:uncharacterized membrane protein
MYEKYISYRKSVNLPPEVRRKVRRLKYAGLLIFIMGVILGVAIPLLGLIGLTVAFKGFREEAREVFSKSA